jgi:hypothetical protein
MTPRDPIEEFQRLKVNPRAHAVYWLRHGELHPEIHFVIRDRLEGFIRRVQEAGPEARAQLLASLPEGAA